MGKIHPAASTKSEGVGPAIGAERAASTKAEGVGPTIGAERSVWTVWKKSSMTFQGTDGFSVYDDEGRLAFRVDNYSRKHKELVLMDGSGRDLLVIRPQIFSMHDQWNGFRSDHHGKISSENQIFSMRRRRSLLHSSSEVEIFMSRTTAAVPDFRIEGCFWRRCCKIRSKSGEVVAQISRKVVSKSVVLSDDVFSLVVGPSVDCSLIMAFVVIMDRVCQKPYTPILCS